VTLFTLWRARQDRAPAEVQARGAVLLAVLCAQGAIGYIQYFSNVPPLLVAIHIAGATAVWVAVLRFRLGLAGAQASQSVRPSLTPLDETSRWSSVRSGSTAP
jgi:heme A synthase